MNVLVNAVAQFIDICARWAAAHWRALVTLLTAGVLLLAMSRLLLPMWAFGTVSRQLQSSVLPPAAAMLFAAVAAAALIMLNPPILRWLLGGGRKREVAVGVVAMAIVVALPALLQGNFGADGSSNKWIKRNMDGTLETSSRDFDPATGEKLEPITPELARQIERQNRREPRPIDRTVCDIEFFHAGTGLPLVWWGERANGTVRLFDAPGYDPQSSRALMPVSVSQVEMWTAGCERR